MEPSCQSDSFFRIKTEEEEMEFELEDLHHSIDIKDETPVPDFQAENIDERMESADVDIYIPYKTCMVPQCKNTTVKTPEKLFLSVPKCAEVRKKWCNAMNRDERKAVSKTSTLYCCGDHFTLNDDLENYWQYKLLGDVKKLRLYKGVIPHKFHCQDNTLLAEAVSVKRRRFEGIVEQTENTLAVDPTPDRLTASPCGGYSSKLEEPAVVDMHIPYKTCMVPKCKNTTVKTPTKLFLSVPKNIEIRRKWCLAMKRDDRKPVSIVSALYCCEDHFTLSDDLENYWQYKLAGNVKKLRLRQGVIPHKFHCQEAVLPVGSTSGIELAVSDSKSGHSVASSDVEYTPDDGGNLSEIEKPEVMDLYLSYKACTVPKCTSTTVKAPETIFISVPNVAAATDPYLSYKSCIVPKCSSSTVKTPEKIFISVPKVADVRRKWCIAMKKDWRHLSFLSSLYICEDHFTLKDDLINYWQHKLVGNVKKFRLKKGLVPHKFHCQDKYAT